MMSYSLFQSTFILRRPGVANVADIIKIVITFVKTNFRDSLKFKNIGKMYENAIFSCIFWHNSHC